MLIVKTSGLSCLSCSCEVCVCVCIPHLLFTHFMSILTHFLCVCVCVCVMTLGSSDRTEKSYSSWTVTNSSWFICKWHIAACLHSRLTDDVIKVNIYMPNWHVRSQWYIVDHFWCYILCVNVSLWVLLISSLLVCRCAHIQHSTSVWKHPLVTDNDVS